MRVGIYFDMRNPAPWARPWASFYADTLALIEQAEAWGIDSVWFSEHHLFEDGYLPQPLTMAAAAAARTRRVRLGTAILVAPFRRAIQIAEEAAIVDLVSGGRLDLGLGAGYVNWEFELFGADVSKRYGTTDQIVRDLRDMLGPQGTVTPPPVQRPIPIWMGYQGPKGAVRVGKLGAGLLTVNREQLEPYRQGLEEGGHDPGTARMAGLVNLIVADDPEAAFETILPHLAFQLNTYRKGAADGSGRTPSEVTVEKLRASHNDHSNVLQPVQVLAPDDAIAYLRSHTEGLPVHEIYCWASVAGMPDELVHRHVELLSTVVRPALA